MDSYHLKLTKNWWLKILLSLAIFSDIMLKPSNLSLPVGALIFFTILFCLPGSAFPKEDWVSEIYFDKWVHIGIFAVLLFLWCRSLGLSRIMAYIILVLIAITYGFLIEFIQDRLVDNRSWDLGDVAADLVGSIVGILVWKGYKKNRPL